MWSIWKKLNNHGLLNINKRNADYVLRFNPRKFFPLVDDKLKTKHLAIAANIATPPIYALIETEHQIKTLENILNKLDDFVIKPAHGAGGDGIIVITGKVFDKFRSAHGKLLNINDLKYHLSRLLSGTYSLGGHPDYAIIEHRVILDPIFVPISYEGIPDIRVLTLLGYPVMAMLRLPTRLSSGKANLHQGAIGAGINIADGKTLGGVIKNEFISYHPDTLNPIIDIQIPYWDEILKIAARSYELTGLGYLGVDIVLDKERGPLMLELNARPGLNIQIANRCGLLPRYRSVEERAASGKESVDARIQFSKNQFNSLRDTTT